MSDILRTFAVWFALSATVAFAQSPVAKLIRRNTEPSDATFVRIETDAAEFQIAGKDQKVVRGDLTYWGAPVDIRRGPYILLANGSRIAATVASLSNDVLRFESTRSPGFWLPTEFPRGELSAIVFVPPANLADRDRWERKLTASDQTLDSLHLDGGDVITGALLEIAADAEGQNAATFRFLVKGTKEPLTIPAERVAAASFKSPTLPPPNRGWWLGLSDGSLVFANRITSDDSRVTFHLPHDRQLIAKLNDNSLEPPESIWSHVVFVQSSDDATVYLSDLKTIGYKHVPLLDWELPQQTDHAVGGSRLRVGSAIASRGIGMPATSRLAFDILPGMKRLAGEVAMDDSAGDQGSVIFRVFLEKEPGKWQASWESKVARGGDAPIPFDVQLGTAKRLALVVDMADEGDVCDWADWLYVRFMK